MSCKYTGQQVAAGVFKITTTRFVPGLSVDVQITRIVHPMLCTATVYIYYSVLVQLLSCTATVMYTYCHVQLLSCTVVVK